jgi:hypothetical protein
MAFQHGRDGEFKLDDSSFTLRDLSNFVGNVDFPRDVDAPETTVFGNAGDRTYIAGGLRGATMSISGFWDPTNSTGPDDVLSGVLGATGSLTFNYNPSGTGAGKVEYSGESILTNYSVSQPVDGVISFTADLQVTGAVTRSTGVN